MRFRSRRPATTSGNALVCRIRRGRHDDARGGLRFSESFLDVMKQLQRRNTRTLQRGAARSRIPQRITFEVGRIQARAMDRGQLITLLGSATDEQLIESHLLQPVPWIFQDDAAAYAAWRQALAAESNLQPTSFFLVGSAATGFSLSPLKPGRDFRPLSAAGGDASDIDVAIVSPGVFFQAWNVIVAFDQDRALRLGYDDIQKLRQHVYWGFVSSVLVPRNTNASRTIRRL